jgi:hypothetical protein
MSLHAVRNPSSVKVRMVFEDCGWPCCRAFLLPGQEKAAFTHNPILRLRVHIALSNLILAIVGRHYRTLVVLRGNCAERVHALRGAQAGAVHRRISARLIEFNTTHAAVAVNGKFDVGSRASSYVLTRL